MFLLFNTLLVLDTREYLIPPEYLAGLLPGGDTLVQQSMMAGTISIDNRHYYFPFTLGGWVLHFWVVAALHQEKKRVCFLNYMFFNT